MESVYYLYKWETIVIQPIINISNASLCKDLYGTQVVVS